MIIMGESVHFVQPGIYSAWTPRGNGIIYITALHKAEAVCLLLTNGLWVRRVRPLQGQYVAHLIDLEAQRMMAIKPNVQWQSAPYDAGENEWNEGIVPMAESDAFQPAPPGLKLPSDSTKE